MNDVRFNLRVVMLGLSLAGAALAQQSQPAPADQKQQQQQPGQQTPPPPPAGERNPTLDELLGLPDRPAPRPREEAPAQPPAPAPSQDPAQPIDEQERRLRDALSGQPVDDRFREAIDLMDRTTQRLTGAQDAGLETQRLQQDVLRTLDTLIEEARRNSRRQQSSSSSSSSQQQDQEQNQQQQQSSQSQQQQQAAQAQPSGQGGDVAQQNAQARAQPAGAAAAWGNLPPHVRDALLQGSTDRFSSTYERLTEEYYRRLAGEE